MYISLPKNFKVEVEYEELEKLGINTKAFNFLYRDITKEEFEIVESTLENIINKSLEQTVDNMKNLTLNQMMEVVLNISRSVFYAHVNNVSCFEKVKDSGFNGMTKEQLLNIHLQRVKERFEFHYNIFKCDKYVKEQQEIGNTELQVLIKKEIDIINNLFESMTRLLKDASYIQVMEAHEFYFSQLLHYLINNVPCLEGVKDESINGMTFQEIYKDHMNRFRNLYTFHANMLSCRS